MELLSNLEAIKDKSLSRDDYYNLLAKVKKHLGPGAAAAFANAIVCEADQYFLEMPEEVGMLCVRLKRLAKDEGKAYG